VPHEVEEWLDHVATEIAPNVVKSLRASYPQYAADAVQEALCRFVPKVRRDGLMADGQAYVYLRKTALRIAWDESTSAPVPVESEPDDVTAAPDTADVFIRREDLKVALSVLRRHRRADVATLVRHVDGAPYAVLAEGQGAKEGALRTQVARFRKKVKAEWNDAVGALVAWPRGLRLRLSRWCAEVTSDRCVVTIIAIVGIFGGSSHTSGTWAGLAPVSVVTIPMHPANAMRVVPPTVHTRAPGRAGPVQLARIRTYEHLDYVRGRSSEFTGDYSYSQCELYSAGGLVAHQTTYCTVNVVSDLCVTTDGGGEALAGCAFSLSGLEVRFTRRAVGGAGGLAVCDIAGEGEGSPSIDIARWSGEGRYVDGLRFDISHVNGSSDGLTGLLVTARGDAGRTTASITITLPMPCAGAPGNAGGLTGTFHGTATVAELGS
jgi:DNA-directed RNA polymerase specialized sigma24 family protein